MCHSLIFNGVISFDYFLFINVRPGEQISVPWDLSSLSFCQLIHVVTNPHAEDIIGGLHIFCITWAGMKRSSLWYLPGARLLSNSITWAPVILSFSFLEFSVIYWIRNNFAILCYVLSIYSLKRSFYLMVVSWHYIIIFFLCVSYFLFSFLKTEPEVARIFILNPRFIIRFSILFLDFSQD